MPRDRRHYRVTEADALSAHERALETGGLAGIRSLDQVLSAIGRPYSGYHRQIERKAAALFEAVATNHGFVDGNKRTAVILTYLLIDQSGYSLVPADDDEDLDGAIEEFAVSVATGAARFDDIVTWFEARIERK